MTSIQSQQLAADDARDEPYPTTYSTHSLLAQCWWAAQNNSKDRCSEKKTEGICSSTVKLLTRLSFEIHSLSFALCFVNIRKISHSTQDIPCWKMEPQGRQCLFHNWFQGKKKNPAHAEGQERESEPSTFFIRTYQSDTKAFTCKLPCILEHIMHAKPDNLSWI